MIKRKKHIINKRKSAGVVAGTAILVCMMFSGASADGLPGEFLLSDQWRTFFKYYSPITNPAFMMEQSYTSIRGVGSVSPDEASKLWELGATVPLGFYNSVGLTVVGENGRNITGYVNDNFIDSSVSRNNNFFFMASYAANPLGKLCIGVNINGAYQDNFGEKPKFGLGVDLGLSYRLFYNPLLGFHLIGLSFQNLVAPSLNLTEKMPHAAQIKGFYHASVLEDKVEIDLQYDVSDFMSKAETYLSEKKLEWNIFIQAGIWPLPFIAFRGFTDYGDTKKIEYFGLGLEINVPQVNGGRDCSILYQFRNELNSNVQGSHSVYFRADVGRNREEMKVHKIARVASLTANELYNRGMKAYYKGDYWNAYFVFQRILTEYPDFYKNDVVAYHAGSSLEEMDMREEAIKAYLSVKENFNMSSQAPLADLGLMRVYYRQGSYSAVSNQFIELNKPTVPDSVRFHGCYIMGESELRQTESRKALQYFELVPESHPAYIFAQHSSSTAHALLNSGTHIIAASLENCIGAKTETKEQKEIANRSLVLLGYIFYEDNALSKAVSALRMVPPESYYYSDALLGLGWTAIKARQWADCIAAGQALAQTNGKFIMQCEGAILQAYGHILEKRYDQADLLLKPILARMRNYPGLQEDSLNTEKLRYESDRISYAFLAERVAGTAQRGSAVKTSEVDSMHSEQIRYKDKIDKYLVFADDFKRTAFFERNIYSLKDDIEYALATVHKILNSADFIKNREKMMHKDKSITNEIEKLKEEMEQLNNQ